MSPSPPRVSGCPFAAGSAHGAGTAGLAVLQLSHRKTSANLSSCLRMCRIARENRSRMRTPSGSCSARQEALWGRRCLGTSPKKCTRDSQGLDRAQHPSSSAAAPPALMGHSDPIPDIPPGSKNPSGSTGRERPRAPSEHRAAAGHQGSCSDGICILKKMQQTGKSGVCAEINLLHLSEEQFACDLC